MNSIDLTHHFLIAMPAMEDPNFSRTLTYIAEHNEQGALGVIINRPIDMTVGTLFERVDIILESDELSENPVFFGGPVQTDRGFVLHRPAGDWQSSLKVLDGIALTSSRDILEAIGNKQEPFEALITLGYAGWVAGQLEEEMAQNAWLSVPADPRIIFDLPSEERLAAAMSLLGIDFAKLSEVAGHA